MGNKICFHPRVILTEDIALHFKSSNLVRDVLPIIEKWRSEGAELSFTLRDFEETFDIVVGADKQFKVFDTDENGRVDAHEILMVYVLLSSGEVQQKIDTVFRTFDFAEIEGDNIGTINFDESMIMATACVKGVQKVCEMDFVIPNDEIFFHVKSLFDMHHVKHDGRITEKQFKEWVSADPSPAAFVSLFHNSQGLPDIYNQVQACNLAQGRVFQMLAHGQLYVTGQALKQSREFFDVLQGASVEDIEAVVDLMTSASPDGKISTDRYHACLRPWNIFNECDLDKSGTLDEKEMEILLWIQLRQRPTRAFVRDFQNTFDEDGSGDISRAEWVKAIMLSDTPKKGDDVSEVGSDLDAPIEAVRRMSVERRKQRRTPTP